MHDIKLTRPFKAIVISTDTERKVYSRLSELTFDQLDPGDVVIKVAYSSVNYKDALAATGVAKIVRRFPCVGGIDLAGEVMQSSNPRFRPGDKVMAIGYDLGVSHHGGYAEYARVPAEWVSPLPEKMSLLESMALGTAGLTAALAIERMEANGLVPSSGPVLVTGATGGVGSVAIDLLACRGYEVVALTSKEDQTDYLKTIGASSVLLRSMIDTAKVKPLEQSRWAGAIDNVGGPTLAWIIATMQTGGAVASIGNAGGVELNSTVYPFILRGVSVLGINFGTIAKSEYERLWDRLADDLKPRQLAVLTRILELATLPAHFNEFINGQIRGRTVVRVT